jgi:hypothetical protein
MVFKESLVPGTLISNSLLTCIKRPFNCNKLDTNYSAPYIGGHKFSMDLKNTLLGRLPVQISQNVGLCAMTLYKTFPY